MKNSYTNIFLFVFFFSCFSLFSQENCKVLKPAIAGNYSGNCKKGFASGNGIAIGTDKYVGEFLKGLPDGKGIYTWATGESYRGEWKGGKRSGEGEYTFLKNGKDSTIYGTWLDDKYIGPIERILKPRIISKTGLDRYTIQESSNNKNRVLFDIYQNGARNTGISNFMSSSSSGYDTNIGLSAGYDEVTFPVTIKVTYTTMNKLKTASYFVEFEVEIYEPGDWRVSLHN
jgi:hypothetical protein